MRSWLIFLSALALIGVLMSCWAFYVTIFTADRYEQLPPGQPLVTNNGISVMVVKLTRTPAIDGGYRPDLAISGSEWVIVDLQVTAPDPVTDSCSLELVGAEGRVWETAIGVGSSDISRGCEDLAPGQTRHSQLIFQVPSSQIDQLYGISAEAFDGSVDQVARPAN